MSLVLGLNPTNELKPIEVDASGLLKIDVAANSGGAIAANVDITGNSVGLATSSNQSTANSSLSTIATNSTSLAAAVSGNELQVDVITSALPSGAATESTLSAAEVHLGNIDTSTSSISSNVATSSNQGTMITDLGNIDTSTATASTTLTGISAKLPSTLGQKAMSASLAVVIASDQSSIPVSSAGGNTTNVNETLTPGANGTGNSTSVDMNGSSNLTIFGNSTNTSDNIKLQVSHNNSNFFVDSEHFVNFDFATGDFAIVVPNTAARYYRITQTDTTTTAFTLQVNSSKK